MEEQRKLDRDLIGEPRLWRLALRVSATSLHVILMSTVENNTLIYSNIGLDDTAGSQLKALENAVYENPLLLSDFDRIDCIVETDRFMVVPQELSSVSVSEQMMNAAFEDFDGEIIMNDLHGTGAKVMMGLDTDFAGFLRRTFNNPRLYHHLTPLCLYFRHKSRLGNSGKMYANMRDGRLDLIAFGKDSLLLANTFRYRDPMDAVYYILACRQSLNLSAGNDELFLAGDKEVRERVTPILREYLAYVMPVIFPSAMFKAGKEALNAPFDLIVLPLCE